LVKDGQRKGPVLLRGLGKNGRIGVKQKKIQTKKTTPPKKKLICQLSGALPTGSQTWNKSQKMTWISVPAKIKTRQFLHIRTQVHKKNSRRRLTIERSRWGIEKVKKLKPMRSSPQGANTQANHGEASPKAARFWRVPIRNNSR